MRLNFTFTVGLVGDLLVKKKCTLMSFPSFQIAGHNVGACQAQMMSVMMSKTGMWEPDNMALYDFGSSRCGDVVGSSITPSNQTSY